MSELLRMFLTGAGIGALVVGAATVLAIAMPLFGMLFSMIATILRGCTKAIGKSKGGGDG